MKQFTRRDFLMGAAAAGLAARFARAQDSDRGARKFTLALVGSAIGVRGTIRQQLDWATQYGYESIEPNLGDLSGMSSAEVAEFRAEMDGCGTGKTAIVERRKFRCRGREKGRRAGVLCIGLRRSCVAFGRRSEQGPKGPTPSLRLLGVIPYSPKIG